MAPYQDIQNIICFHVVKSNFTFKILGIHEKSVFMLPE